MFFSRRFFQIPNSQQLFQFPTATACSTLPKVGRQIQTFFSYFCRQYFWRFRKSFGGDVTHKRRRRRRKWNQPSPGSFILSAFFSVDCYDVVSTFLLFFVDKLLTFVDVLSALQKKTIFLGRVVWKCVFVKCLSVKMSAL
jgi:hypothetical protein